MAIWNVWWVMTLLGWAAIAEAAPKYGPNAVPLSQGAQAAYFRENPAPDFWALVPYYLPQTAGWNCSAANLAMILNAARVGQALTSEDKLVTIDSLVETYAPDRYRRAMKFGAPALLIDSGAIANESLTEAARAALAKLGLKAAQVAFQPAKDRNAFFAALEANEKSANDFIFFSYVQGKLTGDPEGGAHVATVAAYDAKRKLALIMDPDREWYEPYWSPREALFDSIADPKSDGKMPGWIHVRVR